MKKMKIFEPAMCCSTGLCGVGVDPELLRISTFLSNLKQNGIMVDRYNLSSAPQEFINNKEVNDFLIKNGAEKLPVTIINEKIVMVGRYPTNTEIVKMLGLSDDETYKVLNSLYGSNGCGCGGGGCC